jgi:copper chaperone NosL
MFSMELSKTTRVLVAVGSIALISTLFVPLWQIMLWAPQYPEGLVMRIWHNNLSGDVEIINGLNHYIGMNHISVDMFPEFGFIGILIGILALIGLLAAGFGSARTLFAFTLFSYVYGVVALWDFYRWGYEYGHNLDPNAAIKVENMSYQPPVVGYKNLLNFTAYSGPDTGAWIIIVVCLMATVLWWWEFFKNKKLQAAKHVRHAGMAAALFSVFSFSSCAVEPEPIRYGQDNCHQCKMTLTDKRFGAEIITKKGKVYKFDDLNCLVGYIKSGETPEQNIAQMVAVDFKKTGTFVDVHKAFFLKNPAIKSPMRSDIATFSNRNDMDAVRMEVKGGTEMSWEAVKAEF